MDVKEFLKNNNISFKEFTHPPVFTCEEADKHLIYSDIKGVHSKNLFLKERNSKRFYLVLIPANKKLDLNEIETITGDKIKFANEDELKNILGLTKGSVSPFGLINDINQITNVLIDKEIWVSKYVSFHPNINTETLELLGLDFQKYLSLVTKSITLI